MGYNTRQSVYHKSGCPVELRFATISGLHTNKQPVSHCTVQISLHIYFIITSTHTYAYLQYKVYVTKIEETLVKF